MWCVLMECPNVLTGIRAVNYPVATGDAVRYQTQFVVQMVNIAVPRDMFVMFQQVIITHVCRLLVENTMLHAILSNPIFIVIGSTWKEP